VFGNWTPEDGGGANVYNSPVINCTFVGNVADGKGGGVNLNTAGAMTVANTIIYHNESVVGPNFFIKQSLHIYY
jgi:hypothetical protein